MTTREYNTLHKWLAYKLPLAAVCENCGSNARLERANVSGDYLRDRSDYVTLCSQCHRLIDGNGPKVVATADRKREEKPCRYGHTTGVYRYKATGGRKRFIRRCRQCQSEASKRYYLRNKE